MVEVILPPGSSRFAREAVLKTDGDRHGQQTALTTMLIAEVDKVDEWAPINPVRPHTTGQASASRDCAPLTPSTHTRDQYDIRNLFYHLCHEALLSYLSLRSTPTTLIRH